ncbi:MBG domain-containing protein [Pseudomonas sp. NPDC087346]|uniref:MBG domain-containing protein n=1 Tax=Pseudomonas sp. NPDC087346 TaxID=3364438 RepID=UPI003822FDAF
MTTSPTGTVTIFSGTPNTNTLNASIIGATDATNYITYNASAAAVSGAMPGTRNYYYRAPVILSNLTNVTVTKTYDGTTNAAMANFLGAQISDNYNETFTGNVSTGFNVTSAVYNTTHASSGDTITAQFTAPTNLSYVNGTQTWVVNGFSATPTNFTSAASANINIKPKALTVTAVTNSKTYDGTTSSVANATVSGLAATDSLNGTVGERFNSTHVLGTNNWTLAANALTNGNIMGGGLISDYTVISNTANGTITPKALTVTATTDSKVYDGTNSSVMGVTNVSGLVSGDSLTGLTQSFTEAHVLGAGGSTLAVNHDGVGVNGTLGSQLTDYTLSYVNTGGTITPRLVLLTPADASKLVGQVDPIFTYTVAPETMTTGLLGRDVLTGSLGRISGENPGRYSITPGSLQALEGGINFSDYTIKLEGGAALTIGGGMSLVGQQLGVVESMMMAIASPPSSRMTATQSPELGQLAENNRHSQGEVPQGFSCSDGTMKVPVNVVIPPIGKCS